MPEWKSINGRWYPANEAAKEEAKQQGIDHIEPTPEPLAAPAITPNDRVSPVVVNAVEPKIAEENFPDTPKMEPPKKRGRPRKKKPVQRGGYMADRPAQLR